MIDKNPASVDAARGHDASAHYVFGNVLENMGRTDEAVAQFQKAVSIDPNHVHAHNKLGYMLYRLGRTDEAMTYYQRALALKQDHAEAHCGMGKVLAAVGRLEEARRAYDAAIALAPGDASNYFYLGRAVRFVRDDRHFLAMQDLARHMSSLSTQQQIYLHFALAKAFSDVGEHDRSFHHLRDGNALRRQQIPYDEQKTLSRLERIQAVFTPSLIRDKVGLGEPSSVPIFIVGMHRSGTTLVEQILASHPKCFGAGELTEMGAIVEQLHGPNGTEFPEAVPSLSQARLRELGGRYLGNIRRLSATADRIIDKEPSNFVYAGLIHLLFPNARIIHTRRDPRDTALSCFSLMFVHGPGSYCDLAQLGRYYRHYQALMAHWQDVLPADVILEVDYETLVDDFEREARRMVAHCGLEWNDACLSFHRNERPVLTANAALVREPIYRTSVGRWRNYEKFLEPFTQALEGD
jgi:tetratricopeptide (TPR) repeat protein